MFEHWRITCVVVGISQRLVRSAPVNGANYLALNDTLTALGEARVVHGVRFIVFLGCLDSCSLSNFTVDSDCAVLVDGVYVLFCDAADNVVQLYEDGRRVGVV
jgi:hypothetical protein